MTITEHLVFSVVSAPLAQIDRRALSQAWYSALCRSEVKAQNAAPKSAPQSVVPNSAAMRREFGKPHVASNPQRTAARHVAANERKTTRLDAGEERRANRSPLARRIERRFLNPASRTQQATFSLEGDAGRVQVLLKGSGAQMQLVAICAPSACAAVSAALAQARYALAVRGVALGTHIRAANA